MTTFPNSSDLEYALQRLGVLTGSLPTALQSIPDAAIQQWLNDTNIRYWLPTDRSDRFAIENGIVVPHSPILAITSITLEGQTLIENEDYILHPLDATPARYIIFNRWRGDIVINAKFGWSLSDPVPADAWYAILNSACQMAIEFLNTESPGSISRIKQGDVDVAYVDSQTWSQQVIVRYNKVVLKYRLRR